MPLEPTNNITGFVNAFSGGGVRTNLFQVSGNIPISGWTNTGGPETKALSFLVKAAQIPASSIGTIEIPYRGRRIKIPGDRTFADWSITVLSDANLGLRSAFETWSSYLNTHIGNITAKDFMKFMPTWSITPLFRDGSAIRSYTMVGCFPTEVGAIDFSFENNDSVAEFSVTLNYSWWVANAAGTAAEVVYTGTGQLPNATTYGSFGNPTTGTFNPPAAG